MSKNKKYWERRFGKPVHNNGSYHHHFDLRCIDDLNDEGLAYLLEPAKGINMLDVNETDISDKSITLLTRLEYVTELRAKGVSGLTDACAQDLNKIKGLELLHVKNTDITIDGLLQLKDQHQLKTILFSAIDVKAIKEKMLQLKTMHPGCEFVIDGKPYYFDAIDLFMYRIKKQSYSYRLKIKDRASESRWSNWLCHPSATYIEAEAQGTYSITDIEWIDINPIEKSTGGGLIPGKELIHSEEIIKLLEELAFPFMVTERIISVYLVNKKIY